MGAASLVLAGLAPGTHAAVSGASSDKPNIIFVIADDLGWADIGYHNTEVLTPNLDKLAKQLRKAEQGG